jgi:hypothetical protein
MNHPEPPYNKNRASERVPGDECTSTEGSDGFVKVLRKKKNIRLGKMSVGEIVKNRKIPYKAHEVTKIRNGKNVVSNFINPLKFTRTLMVSLCHCLCLNHF